MRAVHAQPLTGPVTLRSYCGRTGCTAGLFQVEVESRAAAQAITPQTLCCPVCGTRGGRRTHWMSTRVQAGWGRGPR